MGSDQSNNLEFLKEIGLGSTNIGSFINGQWKANGSSVTSVNPSTNQVTNLLTFFFLPFFFLQFFCNFACMKALLNYETLMLKLK